MESFFTKLANSNLPEQSSEHLKVLGKRAAGAFMRKEADSLTDAVLGVVSEETLNKEQVRRVAETANQATWRGMFHEGGDAHTRFAPADADHVIGSLSTKPSEVHVDTHGLDYLSDVQNQSSPSDYDLADIFNLKVDSPEYEALNPSHAAQQVAEKTAGALDVARYGVDVAASALAEAGERFYRMVKQAHVTDDVGILQISQAVGQAVDDPTFAVHIMKQASERLFSEGVKFREQAEMTKLAHPLVVNMDHPLMVQAALLEKLAYSHYSASGTLEELRDQHMDAVKSLKGQIRGRNV